MSNPAVQTSIEVVRLLVGAAAVTGVVAIIALVIGYLDRDADGALNVRGQVWILIGTAIISGAVSAGWVMWVDPDRLREGQDYWLLAVPIFGVGCILVNLFCALMWWAARAALKRGWIPALLIPAVALPVIGPWGAAVLVAGCLLADTLFSRTKARTP